MDTYTHYGVEVVRQFIDIPFTQSLSRAGIEYIELPIIAPLVVTYTKDSVKKYAVIVPCSIPDDYQERVYITTEIPADLSWQNLINDVESQAGGAVPQVMQSRLKLMLDTAYNIAFDRLSQAYPTKDMFTPPDIPEAELHQAIKQQLTAWGCDITTASAPDVDAAYLNKIIHA